MDMHQILYWGSGRGCNNHWSLLYSFWERVGYLSNITAFDLLHLHLVPPREFARIYDIRKL